MLTFALRLNFQCLVLQLVGGLSIPVVITQDSLTWAHRPHNARTQNTSITLHCLIFHMFVRPFVGNSARLFDQTHSRSYHTVKYLRILAP